MSDVPPPGAAGRHQTGRRRAADTPFGAGFTLGRWLGIPIRAHWSVLVVMVLFAVLIATVELPAIRPGTSTVGYWIAGAVMSPLLFVTLLAHELAHAVTARHYRLGVRQITLWMLGGLTELEGESPTPRADALIAASGPGTSLLIGLVCAGASWVTRGADLIPAALGWLAGINILLAVFNLLPGAPLDGGRLLRAALWWRGHDRARAAARAAQAGRLLGMVLVGLGLLQTLTGGYLGLWTVLIGWFILNGAASERYSAQAASLAGLKVRDVMALTPMLAPDWWTVEQFLPRLGAGATRQGIFPLVDMDGRFSGAVTLGMLTSARTPHALGTRLHDLPHGHQLLTTTPNDDLATLLLPLHLRGGIAVVLDTGRPVGVITDADLVRAAELTRAGVWRQPGAEH